MKFPERICFGGPPQRWEHGDITGGHQNWHAAFARLRHRWQAIALVYVLSLLLGYQLLCSQWHTTDARRWVSIAACALVYELWLFWRALSKNYRPGEQTLLPSLGLGNTLTLLRGLAIGLLAGFLFSPRPPGGLSWGPSLLYMVAAVGDYLDGYVSRITNQATELGKILDIEIDALGMLVATSLVVQYHQLPAWYLSLGLARYLFVCGVWWRQWRGKPVYQLPTSANRRVIGGFQTGFISVVLWPLFSPPGTTVAGILFAVPVVASFVRDWFVVSGRIDPTSGRYLKARRNLILIFTWWLPVVLRAVVLCAAIEFVPVAVGNITDQLALFAWVSAPALRFVVVILFLVGAILTVLLALGAAGRLAALGLLSIVCADTLAGGFYTLNGLVLTSTIAILLLGTGAFSLWRPEEAILSRRAGERKAG